MLSFSNVPEQKEYKKGKFIRPGVQTLTLKDIYFHISQNKGTKRPVFSMETDPVTDEGWEGHEGAKGQIGDIAGNFGFYMNTPAKEQEFLGNLSDIMKATGTLEAFMEKHGDSQFDTIDEAVKAVKPFLIGTKAAYFVAAEQYQKQNSQGFGLRLKFPNRKFVAPVGSDNTLPVFNESDPKHFRKAVLTENKPDDSLNVNSQSGVPSDLPF